MYRIYTCIGRCIWTGDNWRTAVNYLARLRMDNPGAGYYGSWE